jgi:hypothetical protein
MEPDDRTDGVRARLGVGLLPVLGALLLVAATGAVIPFTCNIGVGRHSNDREVQFEACTPPPLILCSPQVFTWKAWFTGTGQLHGHVDDQTFEETDDYSYDLHYLEHGVVVRDVLNSNGLWIKPWGVQISMGNEVFSYSGSGLGIFAQLAVVDNDQASYADLSVGTFAVNADCPAALYPAGNLPPCFAWGGPSNLGTPGGYGQFRAGIAPTPDELIPFPAPPTDTVGDWPWQMYHLP